LGGTLVFGLNLWDSHPFDSRANRGYRVMRIVRTVVTAITCFAFIPTLASAQASTGSTFENSWFWGVKGGATMFTTGLDGKTNVTAPTVGAEWLITRTRFGMYLSAEQSFFSEQASVLDFSIAGGGRPVDISDMRRYAVGLMAFPVKWNSFRPYTAIGLSLNVIQTATPRGTFTSPGSMDSVFTRVNEESSRASFVFTLGASTDYGKWSFFGQASTLPTRANFLINGGANTYVLEAGVRYRISDAIEKFHTPAPEINR
jgi:hypothetical protein